MLKNTSIKFGIFLFLLLIQGMLHATSGLFFKVSSSGPSANIAINLCLNGKGPVSCQNYTVSGLNIAIKTQVPTHPSPYVNTGIKILTPGYTLVNKGLDCTPYVTGYCLFMTGNSDAEIKSFEIQKEGLSTVGGTISGLNQSGLILQNNGRDDLPIAANATQFQFPTPIRGAYNVTILQNPTGQQCTVMNGTGFALDDISNVSVICSHLSYTISGTVSGLTLSGLVLQNNGTDNLDVAANATSFTFSTQVAYGSGYDVQVLTMPGGGALTCIVYNGTGTNVTANVNNINVICSPPFAYLVNTLSEGIEKCPLSPTGSVVNCQNPVNPSNTFSTPIAITINAARTAAYISNFTDNSISICAMDTAGAFTGCQLSGVGQFVTATINVLINTSSTAPIIYITQGGNDIMQCTITGTSVNYPCATYTDNNVPRGFALNGSNTKIYITNSAPNSVTSCDIDNNGLIIGSSCQLSNVNFFPFSIAVNRAGTRAYIAANFTQQVYICSIINGVLDSASCANSGATVAHINYLALNSTETMAYITNGSNNILYNCPVVAVNNVYSLGSCVVNAAASPNGVAVTN